MQLVLPKRLLLLQEVSLREQTASSQRQSDCQKGASGLGQAYVRALVAANVHVCFGDVDGAEGQKLAAELKGTKFVQCDVTKWQDQLQLFQKAAASSPTGKIHYVVANAGVARKHEVFQSDSDGLKEPNLSIVDINLKGALYTTKLAMHYFIKQNGTEVPSSQEDTCLVLIGSGASHLDVPRGPQYSSTKWTMRGIIHSMRRTTHFYGSRINMISPWYVRAKILSEQLSSTSKTREWNLRRWRTLVGVF